MKKRIVMLALVAVVAVAAVALMLPLQAALADQPDPVKAVVTFVQATWENGKLTVTQGGTGGTVKTVDCPEGSATSVKFSAAEAQEGVQVPFEVQCFELQPGEFPTLPDGEGDLNISTAPFDGASFDCAGAPPTEIQAGKPTKMDHVTVVQVPESGAVTQAMPAGVAGTAVVVNCAGGEPAGEPASDPVSK